MLSRIIKVRTHLKIGTGRVMLLTSEAAILMPDLRWGQRQMRSRWVIRILWILASRSPRIFTRWSRDWQPCREMLGFILSARTALILIDFSVCVEPKSCLIICLIIELHSKTLTTVRTWWEGYRHGLHYWTAVNCQSTEKKRQYEKEKAVLFSGLSDWLRVKKELFCS